MVLLLFCQSLLLAVTAFAPMNHCRKSKRAFFTDSVLNSGVEKDSTVLSLDEEVQRQLAKARELLETAKEKVIESTDDRTEPVASTDESGDKAALKKMGTKSAAPFFFASYNAPERQQVIKSINENGLITTDGEKMASQSEQEPWEIRKLDDVFVDEAAVSSMAGRTLNEKDLATNIMYLRKQLQDTDFAAIFDKRNRFIGDLD